MEKTLGCGNLILQDYISNQITIKLETLPNAISKPKPIGRNWLGGARHRRTQAGALWCSAPCEYLDGVRVTCRRSWGLFLSAVVAFILCPSTRGSLFTLITKEQNCLLQGWRLHTPSWNWAQSTVGQAMHAKRHRVEEGRALCTKRFMRAHPPVKPNSVHPNKTSGNMNLLKNHKPVSSSLTCSVFFKFGAQLWRLGTPFFW